jgi:hypothetical protein
VRKDTDELDVSNVDATAAVAGPCTVDNAVLLLSMENGLFKDEDEWDCRMDVLLLVLLLAILVVVVVEFKGAILKTRISLEETVSCSYNQTDMPRCTDDVWVNRLREWTLILLTNPHIKPTSLRSHLSSSFCRFQPINNRTIRKFNRRDVDFPIDPPQNYGAGQ